MAVRTLLVGLGGTGCEIVARVKRRIGTSDPNVQYVGFDTDGSWEGTDGLPIIYTSREMTVRQYLADVENWEEWFPDSPMLKQRNMIKGAGQARPLSRLAFAETIASGRIGILKNTIKALKGSNGEISPSNFRIMIVSSFAGGTGSGMFIQTALFLREYIRHEYNSEVMIRGLFALPDLFTDKNTSEDQRQSMYANAYASLRELNAINQACLSSDPAADEINMKIDDLFDSKRDRLKAEKKPFDFIFFVDNINSRGMVMSSTEEYKQLLTTATHMQVYSPITDTGDSREDNAILTIIAQDGRPLYGSVGASKLVYPYEDIVKYCGMRATVESISDIWTLVDNEFKKADADNQRLMKNDPTVKPLDKQAHFMATVSSIIEDGNSRLDFITRAITDITEDGCQIDRAEAYFENVYNYVIDKLRNDPEVKTKASETGVKEKQLKQDLAKHVPLSEMALKNYLDTINNRISILRSSMVQAIIPDEFGSATGVDYDCNIMKLIKSNGNIVHPLAMRMLLYKFRAQVSNTLEYSNSESTAILRKINDYFKKAYDIIGTDPVESAIDRANQKGLLQKSRFRGEYLTKSATQRSNLDHYRDHKVIAVVFSDVLKRLDAVIKQFERFFDSLEIIKKDLEKKVNTIENKMHSNISGSEIYLCATPEKKRDLYDSLFFRCSDSNENGVYDSIFYSLYEAGQQALQNERSRASRMSEKRKAAEQSTKMSEIFFESVVKRNIEDVAENCADKLDIDVYQALGMETEDNEAELRRNIDVAYDKALPYLMHSLSRGTASIFGEDIGNKNCAYTLTFWGIHPDVYVGIMEDRDLEDVKTFFTAGPMGEIPEVVSDEEYSRYEISCYQALYCVALTEIPKFVETGDTFGVFYENYHKRVTEMVTKNKSALTPHLDIRWHRRNCLPMISAEKNYEDDLRTARALWLALIYGGLPEETRNGKKVLYASFARVVGKNAMMEELYRSRDIEYAGDPVRIADVYELYKALQLDDITAERFLEVFTKSFEEDMKTGRGNIEFTGSRARKLAKNLISEGDSDRNALNIIARFLSHTKASLNEKVLFVKALQMLIEEFCSELTDDRQSELRSLIYASSRFVKNKSNRAKLERYINFEYWEGNID